MKHIDVDRIRSDMATRLDFLCEFVGLTAAEWQAIRDSAGVLGPVLPQFLDSLYEHLLGYDDARVAFMGADGEVEDELIVLLKEHLTQWVLRMVEGPQQGTEALASYLVGVARKHTTLDGDPRRAVPPRYLVALSSFIQTGILSALFDLLPDNPGEVRRLGLAWNKLIVVQLEIFLKNIAPEWPQWDEA